MWLITRIPQNPSSRTSTTSGIFGSQALHTLLRHKEQSDERELKESFLDLCMHISPEVFLDKTEEYVFIPLTSVSSYWQLAKVVATPDNPQHPFVKHLECLAERVEGESFFVMAPSPALAYWALKSLSLKPQKSRSRTVLKVVTHVELQQLFQKQTLASLSLLIKDKLEGSHSLYAEWSEACETLEEMNIRSALQLKSIFQNIDSRKDFYARFPEIASLLHKRLILAQTGFSLHAYNPDPIIEHRFYPALEEALSSDASQDLLMRVEEMLRVWQLRLESRKSQFRALEITLKIQQERSYKRSNKHPYSEQTREAFAPSFYEHTFQVDFPRGLRNSQHIQELVREKFTSMPQSEQRVFDAPIEEVHIKAKKLERVSEYQLSLFDGDAEENLEKWALLLGKIQLRSKPSSLVQVGSFEAADSYWPENSFTWRPWSNKGINGETNKVEKKSAQKNKSEMERYLFQPKRPMLLLEEAKPTDFRAENLEDYIDYLAENNALESLESLSSPRNYDVDSLSAYNPQEDSTRYYARLENKWIFWDSKQKKVFLHGHFEEV